MAMAMLLSAGRVTIGRNVCDFLELFLECLVIADE